MRKALWLIILALTGGLALAAVYRAEVATWLMARIVAQTLATDVIAELPDGLHLAVCGAGSPMPAADRTGPCLGVIAGSRLFVVDAGSGGARNLQRMGLPAARIESVFLTHFHSDHIDGLGELAMLRWTAGSQRAPLPIHGPPGVSRVVAGFNLA